jgi:hypothetical protein
MSVDQNCSLKVARSGILMPEFATAVRDTGRPSDWRWCQRTAVMVSHIELIISNVILGVKVNMEFMFVITSTLFGSVEHSTGISYSSTLKAASLSVHGKFSTLHNFAHRS